jgi:hypothetical protein
MIQHKAKPKLNSLIAWRLALRQPCSGLTACHRRPALDFTVTRSVQRPGLAPSIGWVGEAVVNGLQNSDL